MIESENEQIGMVAGLARSLITDLLDRQVELCRTVGAANAADESEWLKVLEKTEATLERFANKTAGESIACLMDMLALYEGRAQEWNTRGSA